jgi:hypothetical protein
MRTQQRQHKSTEGYKQMAKDYLAVQLGFDIE